MSENQENYTPAPAKESKAVAITNLDSVKLFAFRNAQDLFLTRLNHLPSEQAKELFNNELSYLIERLNANPKAAPFFIDTAAKNPESLKFAIANVAASGLTLRATAKECSLIPRNGAILFEPEWRGLSKYIYSDARVTNIITQLVYSADKFSYSSHDGKDSYLHDFNPFATSDRGAVIGGYCAVIFNDGLVVFEPMTIEKMKLIQSKSPMGKSGAWVEFESDMQLKTLVKNWWSKRSKMLQIPENTRKNIEPQMEHEYSEYEEVKHSKNYAE